MSRVTRLRGDPFRPSVPKVMQPVVPPLLLVTVSRENISESEGKRAGEEKERKVTVEVLAVACRGSDPLNRRVWPTSSPAPCCYRKSPATLKLMLRQVFYGALGTSRF